MISLGFGIQYSKGQSITDVSKFTTRPDIGTEEEPTIKDDVEEEETIEDDETEPEPTDEEDNDTVTSVPPKRSFGPDLGLENLTTAPLEEPPKLIFASCQIDFSSRPGYPYPSEINKMAISCNVPGASPGDNVVVSSTALDTYSCNDIVSSRVSEPNVVSILLQREDDIEFDGRHDHDNTKIHNPHYGHRHLTYCERQGVTGTVIFSIIVFRPEVPDIIGTLEELRDQGLDK